MKLVLESTGVVSLKQASKFLSKSTPVDLYMGSARCPSALSCPVSLDLEYYEFEVSAADTYSEPAVHRSTSAPGTQLEYTNKPQLWEPNWSIPIYLKILLNLVYTISFYFS